MRILPFLSAALLVCCAKAPSGQSAKQGSIKLTAQASSHLASGDFADGVCASFSFQPYSLDASGNQTLAGSPITLSSVSAAQTDTIAGCIESPGDSAGDNWGYIVTATSFTDCISHALIPGLSPSTVTGNYPVDCKAGIDVPLQILVNVSIADTSNAGYVDISAGVNSTVVEVGCKLPDLSNGALHFGQSNTFTGSNAIALGLVGYTADGRAADSLLAQYGGQVQTPGASGLSSTLYDTYYTGQFTSAPSGGQFPSTILQTFLTDATEENLYDPAGCTTEWADTQHAICLTDTQALTSGAQLADAFLFVPGTGYAAASVSSDLQTLTLSAQHLQNGLADYAAGSAFPAVMDATGGFASDDAALTDISAQAGFNDGLTIRPFAASAVSMTAFTGVFIDPLTLGGFIVAATDGSNVYWAKLKPGGLGWSMGRFTEVGDAPLPVGFGVATSGCVVPPVQLVPPKFYATGDLSAAVYAQTATLLPNGKVLLAGGGDENGAVSSAALYDPASGTFDPTGNMNTARAFHTATLLPNGLVLLTGGQAQADTVITAELYDPAAGTFALTGHPKVPRTSHTATLLPDGLVLVAGGYDLNDTSGSAELYNPGTGTFAYTGSLHSVMAEQTATLLPDGRVLLVGGDDIDGNPQADAELYQPGNGTFSVTAPLSTGRSDLTATLMPNGLVLVAGGFDINNNVSAEVELYDPSSGTFSATANLITGRFSASATLLNNGLVLIAGGRDSTFYSTANAELYDPAAGTFTSTASLLTPRFWNTATLLGNGRVLVAGGRAFQTYELLSSAELYY